MRLRWIWRGGWAAVALACLGYVVFVRLTEAPPRAVVSRPCPAHGPSLDLACDKENLLAVKAALIGPGHRRPQQLAGKYPHCRLRGHSGVGYAAARDRSCTARDPAGGPYSGPTG